MGFDAVRPDSDVIVIHDAARPFCTSELVQRVLDAAVESGAAIAAVAAQDTVKEGEVQSGIDVVVRTVPRERIFLAQTPQAFTPSGSTRSSPRLDVRGCLVRTRRCSLSVLDIECVLSMEICET